MDVRDVARAHVEAVCREGLGGQRILLIGGSPHFEDPWGPGGPLGGPLGGKMADF